MRQPIVGISGRKILGHQLNMPSAFADAPMDLYFSEYAESVAAAGGLPIHLSPSGNDQVVDIIDALVIAGGEDVDSRRYNEAPGPHSGPFSKSRDDFEFALVEKAFQKNIPILGICRGHQLINVALGGSLIQHLELGEGESHASLAYYRKDKSHPITINEDSQLIQIYEKLIQKTGVLKVNSYHHQAVKEPGEGVIPVAWAEDGVIEAFEVQNKQIIGVQWHPECFDGDPIFEWLVNSAKASTKERLAA